MDPFEQDPAANPATADTPGSDENPKNGGRIFGRVAFSFLTLAAVIVGAMCGLLFVYTTDLPEISELEDYRPSTITELYDDQGRVIGTFALQRRVIARYEDLAPVLRNAVISVEDKDFDQHWGVDLPRVFGAAYRNIVSQRRAQGASTLTMQLSRNLFLSADRNFSRKFQEILIAIQIERRFTKPQIFTMYANQIYLGHGVYGFEAGAQFYFSKHARDLNLAEAALLAALPKSGVNYSPILNPQNAVRRRNLVINAMLEDGKVTLDEANAAKDSPISLHLQNTHDSIAPYFVEEVRQYLEKTYGADEVHQSGLRVYTTLNLDWQRAANQAALDGIAAYERRHGWKGGLDNVLASGQSLRGYRHSDWDLPLSSGTYLYALVIDVGASAATMRFGNSTATLTAKEIAWTGRKSPRDLLKVGDLAYIKIVAAPSPSEKDFRIQLEQDSGAQVALLAVENSTGDIKAMVGGRSFSRSKFNRATQALRQVGSSFKPYVYTAALDAGTIKPDDYILDAPVVFPSASGPYIPSNYDKRFWGNIPLRVAVANSRNVPALKVANEVGIKKVIETARRFGITSRLPEVLPLALGAAEVTLYEQVAAFTTFPNDGVRVTPRYIRKVTDYDGHTREETYPEVRDVISEKTSRTMVSLLQGVVQAGTATAAKRLNHPLAGKTGTTNDFTDAWFVGFSPSITCGVWIGFDEKKSLGNKETGGEAALPIWIEFMKVALTGRDKETFTLPPPETRPAAMAASVNAVSGIKKTESKAEAKPSSHPPGT
jgi:penicillin-binding protein 1A